LAQAGFYYRPSSESPDSVECFLCRKGLDGWEEEDDPVEEHLKHSADCGWAVNVSIEQKSEEQKRDHSGDPLGVSVMAARRATFAERWPHENKKGWLCKITKVWSSTISHQTTTTTTVHAVIHRTGGELTFVLLRW
ncbi:hypothetical protein GP486_007611, partial [Trichoglossum hirsutum]